MIETKLKSANLLLSKLIKLTEQGIEDIKNAKKDRLELQNKEKTQVLNDFLKEKQALDKALFELANSNNGNVSELLSKEASDLLGQLRFNLNYLLAKNKEYSKYVLSVKEFYDSLLTEMLKDDMQIDGYKQNFGSSSTLDKKL